MHQLWFPTRLLFGEGALGGLGEHLPSLGRKALLVTGATSTARMPAVGTVKEMLGGSCVHFTEVGSDPDVETVERGAARGAAEGVDLVIGLGGGSPLDAAKAVAARLTNEGPASAFFGVNRIAKPPLPLVCIPTTSGTGSEATPIAVLTDAANKRKISAVSPLLYPALSVVDPELTVSMSPELTAATGADALTHAVESYVAVGAWEITRGWAFRAVSYIASYLRRAFRDGSDMEARHHMALASTLAGMAFSHSGLGLAHALAHPLGALFGTPHGVANAILLPAVMEFNAERVPEVYRELAFLFGSNAAGLEPREAALRAAAAVRDLFAAVGLPTTISACGAREEHIPLLASEAVLNERLRAANPRETTLEEIEELYRSLL